MAAIVSWWLIFENPIVWAYFSLLILVGGYLLKEAGRTRSSLAGVLISLCGLVVLAFGVSFSNVVALTTGAQQLAWLIPPGAGIRLGDGLTLELHNDSYTYYVNTLGVLAGYLLFLGGLTLVEFEDASG